MMRSEISSFRSLLYFVLIFSLGPGTRALASDGAGFSYVLQIAPTGYDLRISLQLYSGTSLSEVVADLRNPDLLHELNPKIDPLRISDELDGNYDSTLTFHVLGFAKRMLSHCHETSARESWGRVCDLDTRAFGSGSYMDWKKEEVSCGQKGATAPVHCDVRLRGRIKSVYWLRAGTLTVKAKYQALLNWARLWYFMRTQSLSPALALRHYDPSRLRASLDALLKDGVSAAKQADDSNFRYSSHGEF